MNELDADAKTIFLEAIAQPSPERMAAFVDAACRAEGELRPKTMSAFGGKF